MKNKFKLSAEQMIEDQKKYAIPSRDLSDLPYVDIKSEEDFDKISKEGGTYWITTDEPILFNRNNRFKEDLLDKDGYSIVYNGTSEKNVSSRIKEHLYRTNPNENLSSRSAISVEPSNQIGVSHSKKLMAPGQQWSAFNVSRKRIRSIEHLQKDDMPVAWYSRIEEVLQKNHKKDTVWMKNGINAIDDFHSKYNWRVYFLTGIPLEYAEFVERNWRIKNGSLRLCTYSIK